MPKFLLCALFASFAVVPVSCAPVDPPKPLDLKFTAVDGRKVDLAQLRGKVVLIDFWATWCPPCRLIAPDILAAYKKYHSQGFEVIGVSDDSDKDALLDFIKKEGAPWPQYFDDSGNSTLIEGLGIDSFPTLWLIDKKGMVVNADFRDLWAEGGGIPFVTSEATHKKIDAELEKQLKAP